jgi:hydrogenase expression/formation protein HypE
VTEQISKKFIQLAHGGGGQLQNELIDFITKNIPIKRIKDGIGVDAYDDGATIPLENYDSEIVITADGHTVDPIIFPGGDLGKLAASGTINDLIMMGSHPIAITSTILIEEGTEFDLLDTIIKSFNAMTEKAQVAILAGDTKVMPHGSLKGIVMSTSGVGIKPKARQIFDANCQVGAKIILTGSIGDHGCALMAKREGINFETTLQSDVAPLIELIPIFESIPGIIAMKDPTRGGVASALNEWAKKSKIGIEIDETQIIVHKEVRAVADLLGLDPLEVSNEGKALICVRSETADKILETIRKTSIGAEARIIGQICASHPKMVVLKTQIGGSRIIEMPLGEPIPRVC